MSKHLACCDSDPHSYLQHLATRRVLGIEHIRFTEAYQEMIMHNHAHGAFLKDVQTRKDWPWTVPFTRIVEDFSDILVLFPGNEKDWIWQSNSLEPGS